MPRSLHSRPLRPTSGHLPSSIEQWQRKLGLGIVATVVGICTLARGGRRTGEIDSFRFAHTRHDARRTTTSRRLDAHAKVDKTDRFRVAGSRKGHVVAQEEDRRAFSQRLEQINQNSARGSVEPGARLIRDDDRRIA